MGITAVITGATGGLGGAFAHECAKRGYNIIISGTKANKLQELECELKEKYKDIKIYSKTCNLASLEDRLAFVEFIKNNNIKVNMLINNAGYIFETSFLSCEDNEVLNAIRVNCEGTIDISQKLLKIRDNNENFYLLTVSSLSCYTPMPQMAIYASSKAFLTNWSVALREELKNKNVNVTVVCPGGMATNDAMKASIKSQGVAGKLSCEPVEKVAKNSICALFKNKAIYIPGWFNKFMHATSVLSSKKLQAKVIGKRWSRCEKKRGELK